TGKTAVGAAIDGTVEHAVLEIVGRAGSGEPGVLDIDMTGGAGAGTAALGVNAGHAVLHRNFHRGNAVARFQFMPAAVAVDKGDLGQNGYSLNIIDRRTGAPVTQG